MRRGTGTPLPARLLKGPAVMLKPLHVLSIVALSLVACGGSSSSEAFTDEGALERRGNGNGTSASTTTSVEAGSFAMLAGPPVHSLPGFGCRHYMRLELYSDRNGAAATFEAALDSADPSDMDEDGACGGEELPHGTGKTYVLHEVSKNDCGARVLEGTVNWTDNGAVTRTLRITDNRKATCGTREAKIKLEESRALRGESNPIETYYSVDPR